MKKINAAQLKQLIEASIFVADRPVTPKKLKETVLSEFDVSATQLSETLKALELDYAPRGIQLVKVASGYRFQSLDSLAPWLQSLWPENAPRYSRALLETLALIAYRQPITRGEIEQIRGVAVSSNIIKTLTEREWVTIVGHKEVAGRPALYATTSAFLDYFSLTSLSQLPSADAFATLALKHADMSGEKKEVPSATTDRTNDKTEPKSMNTHE
ncbi:SMC-Scp complex subunit ScpB [Salinimonas marina]|uniref:SMC-Scp complex subunit ScpB n=1 Tax=Salinimonas marina TaxID=2785918 RepID=A0A7S9DVH7_9ALTE|nr:SMC-Scp complex subunit ScpB [Salinimonas marina]QPG04704.1 SMC-Scp complex subunit ScpB [Salinimonas marina]